MRPMVGLSRLALGALLLIAPAIIWAETAALGPTVPERVTWEKTPIALALTVGKERRVDFPSPVKVGVPAKLQATLRVQSVAGTLREARPLPLAQAFSGKLSLPTITSISDWHLAVNVIGTLTGFVSRSSSRRCHCPPPHGCLDRL